MTKIMVVDDDVGFRRMTCRTLQGAGYEVVAYGDGRAALSKLEADAPDLMVTDIFMPEMEGLETIHRVRGLRPEMPIVAMSGVIIEGWDYLSVAKKFGADAALKKPFRFAELLDLIVKLLAGR
jgi:CheY-like chemotaxis protein